MPAWFNQIVLTGKIQTDPEFAMIRRKDGGEFAVCNFVLTVKNGRGQKGKGRFLHFPVKLIGYLALHLQRLDIKKGDYVQVSGRIEERRFRDRHNERRRWHYLQCQHFSALWPPPSRLIGGHALVPVDELRRLKALCEEPIADEYIPEHVARQIEATDQQGGSDD